ncbi:MAG: glycine cleavage system aminomethyltransferase GcvT [Micavibrio aeruginosavorus]|uniref:aminomethyltransferase n=1 Tax=Micavibrio aeruginosavorus TaxID=349221 RepID=A0A2W5MXB8_9BACT|nr:MAG: glycine cleavage system aminomethyltransferase GcvT [Micavibrio aeruginosavorus]
MKKTPLHAKHLELKARMAEFAGYDMPIQYETGVLAEHNWTREHCGLFDVSHMGQIMVEGAGVAAFWEKLTPSSISKLGHGVAKYTVLTNEQGGIIDDLIITRMTDDKFFAVINAGCKDKDIGWLQRNLPHGAALTHFEDRALLAVQGPEAETVLREALEIDATNLGYMRIMNFGEYWVSRLGYTGEDGFEISLPADHAQTVWTRLTDHPAVKPVGLAARDSLRLEMGYPLYGHDITVDTSPIEADLRWIMGKDRHGYIGEGPIINHLENGPPRLRMGIKLTDKGVAREGAEILSLSGEKLGDFTSGGFSPTLNISIGQGYVDAKRGKIGDEVLVRVRGRDIKGVLCALPFVKPRTKTAAKQKAA